MTSDRLARILNEFSVGSDSHSSARLCEVSREVIGVTGAGIMLISEDLPQGSICASDTVSGLIEDLQYMLGQGPCIDAHNHDRVVLEPDLADPVTPRWLAFAPPALEAGVRAMFAFPTRVGAVRLGSMNLYRDQPGPLTDDQHANGLVMADVAAQWVLDIQAEAPPGSLANELEVGADLHFVVHNAAGMVSVQAGISVTEALVRLRAYAFKQGRPLREASEDVVAGRVRFE